MHQENEMNQEIVEVAPAPFEINSPKRANWLIRKFVEARNYSERVKQWAERERRRAEREEQSLMHLFGRPLEAWVAKETAASGGRRKSVSLRAGTVGPLVQHVRDRLGHWALGRGRRLLLQEQPVEPIENRHRFRLAQALLG